MRDTTQRALIYEKKGSRRSSAKRLKKPKKKRNTKSRENSKKKKRRNQSHYLPFWTEMPLLLLSWLITSSILELLFLQITGARKS